MLRSIKMYGMAQAVSDLTEQGAPAFDTAVPILSQLLKAELAEREVRSVAYQIKAARFPAYKDLTGFDFASSEVSEALVRQLHAGEFMAGTHNVVLIGGPGTGKTHIATALGVQAVEQEKALNKAGQLTDRLSKLDLVILDELGYLPFSPSRRSTPVPPALEALRADQRGDHHQSQLQRMGWCVRRCQDDNGTPRPPHSPLPHP